MRPLPEPPHPLEGPSTGPGAALRWTVLGAVTAVLLLGVVLHLGVRPLELEEPRRALVALEFGLRQSLLVPTTNGVPYLRKPPVFSWVLLGVMRLAGSASEEVLRLPTVVSYFSIAGLLLFIVRRHLGSAVARLATAMFLTFGSLVFYGTLHADIDLFLALLILLQALSIFLLEQRGRPLALFACSYLLGAVVFLTKGLPALAFQALTLAGWLLWTRRGRWLLSWRHLAGLGVFGLAVGGYLALYARQADPAALLVRLLADALERTAASPRHSVGAQLLHLLTFPLELLQVALPWSAFAGVLFLPAARARIREFPLLSFCAVFLCVNLLPFWLSPGTRPRYLFPLLPLLAVLLAATVDRCELRSGRAATLRWVLGVAVTAAALLPLGLPLLPRIWQYVRAPWAWYACAAALLAVAGWYWRSRGLGAALGAVMTAIALARVQYDLVVPELRRATSEDSLQREVAAALAREFPSEPVHLAGARYPEELRIPGLGRLVSWTEREFFPSSLSFYYALERGEPLRWDDRPAPGQLLLVHPGFAAGRPRKVLRVFDLPGEKNDLQLIRLIP